jgi:phosphoglycolate phosphatase-like HAD superfamily hydrolase
LKSYPQKIGLIFDLDGTLFKVETVTVPAVKAAFKSLNLVPPAKNRILSGIGKVTARFYEDLLPEGSKRLVSELRSIGSKNEVLLLRQKKGELYPGSKRVLGQLKAWGFHLGLVSNSGSKYFREVINAFGLAPLFDQSLCAGETKGFEKKDLVKRIGDLLGGEKAIVIGDRQEDILAAKENGLKSVGCLYGYGSRGELQGAEWKIEKIKDLISIFAP